MASWTVDDCRTQISANAVANCMDGEGTGMTGVGQGDKGE